MRISRPAAGALVAVLLGAAAVTLPSPASAARAAQAAPVGTSTVADPSVTVIEFGQTVDVSVDVDAADGGSPSSGTSTLFAQPAGATDWTAVATSTSPSSSFLGVKPGMNTTYKVVYGGWTAPASDRGDSWSSSESAPFAISVARRITHPSAGFLLEGRVSPKYARKPIRIRATKTQGRRHKLVATIRTDRKGSYSYTLPKRRGTWYWLISVKGDTRFRATSFTYETRVF